MLAQIPWFQLVRWYVSLPGNPDVGVVVSLFPTLLVFGFVVSFFVARRYAVRSGLDRRDASTFFLYTIVGAVALAHVLNTLLFKPERLSEALAEIGEGHLSRWPFAGFSSFGALLGGFLGAALWKRRRDLDHRPFLDALAFSAPFGWFFVRSGCFVVHDHPGIPTDFVLGVADYRTGAPPYVTRHDLGLYEMIGCVISIALLVCLAPRIRPAGVLPGVLLVLYMPLRFLGDFLRASAADGGDARYMGLTVEQYACVPFLLIGLFLLRGVRFEPRPQKLKPG